MATTTPKRVDKGVNLILLSNLLTQINSFLPIFRLPPETLEGVFTHATRDYYEDNDRFGFRVPHWVNISYVCRHWRNIALNCPMLWTYHFTVSPRWTEELLARSKHASLKIRINHRYGRPTSSWSLLAEKVLSHAERIQELRLSIPDGALPISLSSNFPHLRTLEICFLGRPSQWIFNIINGDTLALRTLKLEKCPLFWCSSLNLSGVTTLSLRFLHPPYQQNLSEFLTTLSCMQGLTVLDVAHALPSSRNFLSSGAFAVSPKVTLPCLARISVRAPLSTVVGLLSCLDMPLKTHVKLDIESEDDSSIDDYLQLPSVLAQRFSQCEDLSSSIPEIRSLIICFAYNSEFTLTGLERSDCDPYLSFPSHDCTIPLEVHVTMGELMAIQHASHIVGDICCSIPMTHVQTLHIMNPPFTFSDDFWRPTVGHLNGLRCMKLTHGYMPNLHGLFARINGSVEPPRHTFVPGLEELELYRITFSSADDWSEEFISDQQSIVDALSTRKTLRLTMTECDVKVSEALKEDEEGSDVCECGLCILGLTVH